jgi:16S rRNA (uracil1498-N3)-methyltransferase
VECLIVRPEDVDRDASTLTLRDDEAHHALRSLRLKAGDELLATDLIGVCYRCRVVGGESVAITCSIEEVLPEYGEPKRDVLLVQALISQPARWEFLLEKATELGVRAIQPVTTERTERADYKRDRSERILRAAVKQTKRARMPELREVQSLEEALTEAKDDERRIIILHEGISPPLEGGDDRGAILDRGWSRGHKKALAIVVGPEGGFSDEEVRMACEEFGASVISLGPRRLRSETAALAALALIGEG